MMQTALGAWSSARDAVPGEAAITPAARFAASARPGGAPTPPAAPEHEALRSGAGLWDRGAWGLLRFSGKDRLTFLNKYCTQEVKALAPGAGAYGCCLTVKGGMVADLWVLARAEDALVIVAPAAREALPQHLAKYALFDKVKIEPAAELTLLSLWGPRAEEVVTAVVGAVPAGTLAHAPRAWGEATIDVVRDPQAGLAGVTLVVPAAAAPALADALLAAGATPVGSEALEAARVAGRWPLFGVDLDERTIPIEAGLEATGISFTKGCYIGQEVIARIAHRGHVNRTLASLRLDALPAQLPAPLLREGKEAGSLTSAARTAAGEAIGLALIHRKHAEPGTALKVGADGPGAIVTSPSSSTG